MQTANSLPAVLFALVAGTVADIVDRRLLALVAQLFMLAAAAALAVLTFTDTATAAAVLGLTFVLGSGMATTFVVYQSLTPEVVSRAELPAAVALNGVAINLARAAGPALAGLCIAVLSAGALFSIEAALMAAVIAVVLRLRLRRGPPAAGSSSRRRCEPGCASCASPGPCGPCSPAARCSVSSPAGCGRCSRWWRCSSSTSGRGASAC